MSMIYGGSNITFPDGSTQNVAPNNFGFKNRIINGAMMIDQRNAGASVSLTTPTTYVMDRWGFRSSTSITVQRSTTATTGFVNSAYVTVPTGGASAAGAFNIMQQVIEGLNVADLAWGTASASPVTLSFKVRSSQTGTFAGAIRNWASDRSYVFTYTISAANTWTTASVTIPGCTDGTWVTDNTGGLLLTFDLGCGSTYATSSTGTWLTGTYGTATGAVQLTATTGATFYITGVQLEKGSTATSFDYRPYGTELALCQRYYYRVTADIRQANGYARSTTQAEGLVQLPVTMRTAPTALEQTGTATDYTVINQATATTCSSVPVFIAGSTSCVQVRYTVASGLTAGNGLFIAGNTTAAYLGWSAEL